MIRQQPAALPSCFTEFCGLGGEAEMASSRVRAPQDEEEHATPVGLVYWALADARREAPWFSPKTTTVAPVFTRL
jgi:hypothetical protein